MNIKSQLTLYEFKKFFNNMQQYQSSKSTDN